MTVVVLVVAALFLEGIAGAQAGSVAKGTLRWRSCGGSFECSTMRVPLDYSNPAGAQVNLAVIRRPARDQSKRIGSLVVNPGGPGGSGVEFVASQADSMPDELSLGMQRRVAIARALASGTPKIILYDEPTTGLDPNSLELVTEVIVRLREELGMTSIVVTHQLPDALKVGTDFLFLYDRTVHFEGKARDLALSDDPDLAHFLDPFKKSLVSAVENFGLVHTGPERTPPR